MMDFGRNLTGRYKKELFKLLGVRGITTTQYYPATDGMVEQFNGSLKEMIRKTTKKKNGQWDLALPFSHGKYQSSSNTTTGFTPSELLHGRQIR